MTNQQRGLAPLIIVAIVAVVLTVGGVGGYFGYKALKKDKTAPATPNAGEQLDTVAEDVEPVLPALYGEVDLTGAGLPAGELPSYATDGDYDLSAGSFDFSGLTGFAVEVSGPTDSTLTAPPVPDLMPSDFDFSGLGSQIAAQQQAAQQQQQQQQQQPPPTEQPPSQEPPPSEPPAQSQVNGSNCAQFASMPSASYCSAVGDPNGIQLCQDCKAAGY